MERTTHFASFYDPSIADFVAAYLIDSPEDAVTALDGSVFIEQTLRLIGALNLTTHSDDRLMRSAAEAAVRTDDSPAAEWQLVHYGRGSEPKLVKLRPSWARRAARLGRLSEEPALASNPHAIDLITTTYERAVNRAKERWRDGYDDPELAIALVREMLLRDEDIADAASAAKTLVLHGLGFVRSFADAEVLRDLLPAVFDDQEWASVQERLRRVAHDELTNWEEMDDISEIEQITDVAQQLQVEIDVEVIEEATRSLSASIDRAEERAMKEARDRPVADVAAELPIAESDDTEAVRAIFARLAAE